MTGLVDERTVELKSVVSRVSDFDFRVSSEPHGLRRGVEVAERAAGACARHAPFAVDRGIPNAAGTVVALVVGKDEATAKARAPVGKRRIRHRRALAPVGE
jgi:hypothetical protein